MEKFLPPLPSWVVANCSVCGGGALAPTCQHSRLRQELVAMTFPRIVNPNKHALTAHRVLNDMIYTTQPDVKELAQAYLDLNEKEQRIKRVLELG